MLRKALLSTTAVVSITGSALAADLPSRAAPPVYAPPIPIFTWTGVYLGGDIGYAWGANSNSNVTIVGPRGNVFSGNVGGGSVNGVIGGAHVGYNYQFGPVFGTGAFVAGLEGDVEGSSLSRTVTLPFVGPFGGTTLSARENVTGSIRGRIGVAFDRVLLYATGGAAFGGFESSINVPGFGFFQRNTTRVGYTVGGGLEYAVTNNWSVRAEYRYSNYGHLVNNGIFNASTTPFLFSRRVADNEVRVGFSYKFDVFAPPAPVVAKY
jgi:outer membrane immunogenic protein